jgi:hypothetical protein
MLTFTPLSGAAKSSRTSPLAYLLQVDDINILLDCGSPDWCPEPPSSENAGDGVTENKFHWEQYCNKLKEWVLRYMRSGLTSGVLTTRSGSLLQLTSFFSPMEIFHTPDYTLTHTRGGASKLRRILLYPCKPWLA